MRIIGGRWRSRLIPFPDVPGLRPTPDRVRETLFNWLGQDLTGLTCLDLFAGSGVLGFEAASRGARQVVLIDSNAEVVKALRATATALDAPQVEVVRADALEFLRSDARAFDVVFLDPPFGRWDAGELLALLPRHLRDAGRVYVEAPGTPALPAGWQMLRQARAGQVRYHLIGATPSEKSDLPGNLRPDHPRP